MTSPLPKAYVTSFLQLVTSRQFARAERVLERINQKIHLSERNKGYLQALSGILLVRRSNSDEHALLSKLNFRDEKELNNYRKEFMRHSTNNFRSEYDRGFFEAWIHYMRVLIKLNLSTHISNKGKIEKKKRTESKSRGPFIEVRNKEERTNQIEKKEITVEVKTNERTVASSVEVKSRQRTLFDF